MINSLVAKLLSLSLLLTLFACSDHRLGGSLSPARLRLKTVQGGSINTTYTYDSQNRPSTITNVDGSQTVLTYDAQNRPADLKQYPNPANLAFGSATLLSYGTDGVSFQAKTYYIINSVIESGVVRNTASYSFDASKHIISVTNQREPLGGGSYSGNFYTYTGETITNGEFVYAHSTNKYEYEYDDKANPFFGSSDPIIFGPIDPYITDLQRFSRNNLTKITNVDSNGNRIPYCTYQYEYNQQGLPTKRTTIQGGTDVITYTYESY